jgi:signal peptidase II
MEDGLTQAKEKTETNTKDQKQVDLNDFSNETFYNEFKIRLKIARPLFRLFFFLSILSFTVCFTVVLSISSLTTPEFFNPDKPPLFALPAALILIIIMICLTPSKATVVSAALFIGGGLSNVIERYALGPVADYWPVPFDRYAYFNIADLFIVLGLAIFIINTIRFICYPPELYKQ